MRDKRLTLLLSIGLLSASVIAYQLVLMQTLSIQQWHYMAFMVISLALLGFGASGTLLAIFKNRLLKSFGKYYSLFLACTSVFMVLSPWLAGSAWLQFDTYLLFVDIWHIVRLLATCLLYFLPFLFAATAIGMSFTHYAHSVGKLYFANLLGSGLGGIGAVLAMWLAMPQHLYAVCALLPLIGAIIYYPLKAEGKYGKLLLIVSLLPVIGSMFYVPSIRPSQYKSLSKAMDLPGAKVVWERNSPFGLVQKVTSPAIRYAPSISLLNTDPIPRAGMVFVNGEGAGYFPADSNKRLFTVSNSSPQALVYHLKHRRRSLVLQSGAGERIHLPLLNNGETVTATETNSILQQFAKRKLDGLGLNTQLQFRTISTRSFLKKDQQAYDAILFPVVGSFYGTTGLYALEEQNWLTVEAFAEAWQHLTPDGVLSVDCWLDYPYRSPYKLMATIHDMLGQQKNTSNRNIIAIKNWNQLSLFVKRTAFTEMELKKTKQFCDSLLFDLIVLDKGYANADVPLHQSNDTLFMDALMKLTGSQKNAFYKSYPFKVKPASDDKPYFSHFLKLSSLLKLNENYNLDTLPYFELGYFMAVVTLIILVILGVLFIILPLYFVGKIKFKAKIFYYFGAIGLGYMITEMLFIHQFNIYFENPSYTMAIIIAILLISSGAGSYFSEQIVFVHKLWVSPLVVSILLVLSLFLTPVLISSSISLPLTYRLLISTVAIGIIGFFMGLPFPLAISTLSIKHQHYIPMAWAINGFFSVMATPLAVLLSIEFGFSALFMVGIVSYLVASMMAVGKLIKR